MVIASGHHAHAKSTLINLRLLGKRVQEVLETTRSLVKDWSTAYALCPASFPPADIQEARQRSKCFEAIPETNRANVFWLTICRVSHTCVPLQSCLFQPIGFPVPFPHFRDVLVIISGYGDGVRRGICNAVRTIGGECASWHQCCIPLLSAFCPCLQSAHMHALGSRLQNTGGELNAHQLMLCRVIESVTAAQWAAVTLLLTDSPASKKYVLCRAKGIPCVQTTWLTACLQHGDFVDPKDYVLQPDSNGASTAATQSVPVLLEATQAAARPQYVSQGVANDLMLLLSSAARLLPVPQYWHCV